MYSGMIIGLVIYAIVGLAICAICCVVCIKFAEKKGYSKPLFGVMGFLLSVIGVIIAAVLPNNNETKAVYQANSADSLLKYKQLLDANVITEEEFEEKKRELLNGTPYGGAPQKSNTSSTKKIVTVICSAVAAIVALYYVFNSQVVSLMYGVDGIYIVPAHIAVIASCVCSCAFAYLKKSKVLLIASAILLVVGFVMVLLGAIWIWNELLIQLIEFGCAIASLALACSLGAAQKSE